MPDVVFLEREEHLSREAAFLHEKDSHGAHKPNPAAGELAPMVAEGLSYEVPIMVTDQLTGEKVLAKELRSVEIRPSDKPVKDGAVIDPKQSLIAVDARFIPEHPRVIETINPQVVSLLVNGGGYQVCDPPKSSAQTRAKNATGATSAQED